MIDDVMNRLKVKRGEDLPHSKLTDDDVRWINSVCERREQLQAELKTMTNQAMADKLGLHRRTVDRVTAGENWGHVV